MQEAQKQFLVCSLEEERLLHGRDACPQLFIVNMVGICWDLGPRLELSSQLLAPHWSDAQAGSAFLNLSVLLLFYFIFLNLPVSSFSISLIYLILVSNIIVFALLKQ